MKNKIKLFAAMHSIAIIAIAAIIGFIFIACDENNGEKHSHSYSDTWSKDGTQHWKECSCGDKTQIANHTGNPCGVCGYTSGGNAVEGNDSQGLLFSPINSNTAYSVSKGTATATTIVIPATFNELPVTTIAVDGFRNYPTDLTSITIPASVTTIRDTAFRSLTNLANVTFAAGSQLETIGVEAFRGCSNLSSITLPANLKTINGDAFYSTNLSSITIPTSVTTINGSVFVACNNLTEIIVDASNANYSSSNGVLFNKTQTRIIRYPAGKTGTSYTIPASVSTIGNYAFHNCTKLTSITLPVGLTTIEYGALWDCENITTITIPATVTNMGSSLYTAGVFTNWRSTQTINIPFANQAAADTAWGNTNWRSSCNATINYVGSSNNPTNWALVANSTFGNATDGSSDIEGVAYGNGTFVAVGSGGKMAYSTNGTTWTPVANSSFGTSFNNIYGVAWGNNMFIAVGQSGKIAYSTNGTTWTPVTNTTFPDIMVRGIAYGNGKFVAGGYGGRLAYSTDGINWTPVADSKIVNEAQVSQVIYGNDKFVARASSQLVYSTDGINWQTSTHPFTGSINPIAWGSNKFVANSGSIRLVTSADGITWSTVANPTLENNWWTIGYGNNMFVACIGSTNGRMAYSTDGITWTTSEYNQLINTIFRSVVWGNDKFVAVGRLGDGTGGQIAYSGN